MAIACAFCVLVAFVLKKAKSQNAGAE